MVQVRHGSQIRLIVDGEVFDGNVSEVTMSSSFDGYTRLEITALVPQQRSRPEPELRYAYRVTTHNGIALNGRRYPQGEIVQLTLRESYELGVLVARIVPPEERRPFNQLPEDEQVRLMDGGRRVPAPICLPGPEPAVRAPEPRRRAIVVSE